MIKKLKFYILGHDELIKRMILERGHWVQTKFDEDTTDGVIFTGGEDVTPFLYGEKKLPETSCNIVRDQREVAIFKNLPQETRRIGICRGAQLLNVLSGGCLWQDVNYHRGSHLMKVDWQPVEEKRKKWEGKHEFLSVTSTHHQMMIPAYYGEVWASARMSTEKRNARETWRINNSNDNDFEDAEVVHYWHTNSLCFQPHPEYEGGKDCREYFWDCVEYGLFNFAKLEEEAKKKKAS